MTAQIVSDNLTTGVTNAGFYDPAINRTYADAILVRIVHNACRLELEGQSMRKTIAKMDDETAQT